MFKYYKKQNKNGGLSIFIRNRNAGFAVLFAVLLASFLITLGISIFSISLKEIQIATSARDSQIAYYVADSARECALYWHWKYAKFPVCIDSACITLLDINGEPYSAESSLPVTITCNNIPVTLSFNKYASNWTYSAKKSDFFQASSTSSSTPVSDIKITTKFIPSTSGVVTIIETWGHNTGILGRRVERGFSQTLK